MIRRWPALIAAALVLMLTAAACGGSSAGNGDTSGGSEEDGTTILRVFEGIQETPRLEAEAEKAIEDFEAQNPDIDVQRESVAVENQRTVIQTRLRSDQPPDVFGYDTGPGFAGVLAKADLLHSLEDAYEQYNWPIYDWAQQRVTYDGTLYGVPGSVEQLGVYYNKDLFSDMGFEEPQSTDDLDAIATAVQDEGITPFAFGDQEQWPAGHLFSMALSNILGREGIDNILYGNGKWNDPEVVEAIELMFSQFTEQGYYPDDVNAITYDDANTLFYAGEAAMLPTGTWLIPDLDELVQDFEVGFFPFPSIDGSSVSPPGGVGGGLFVAANTEVPEAAFKYLDYTMSKDSVDRGIEVFNEIPAFQIDPADYSVSPLFETVLDELSEATNPDAYGYNIDVLTPANFNTVMFEGFQEVLNGTRTPEEQADALQEAWAEAKAAGDTLEAP
ncbi:MAG: extracellular solute-binding protein [Actinomycetota bacterium]|nr:extracellular solute-binding protein [Actinomycetota bacterium]